MTRERLYLYDTTLRDGQQSQGVDFSVDDKLRIAAALDALGIDYVEGGWPGANPTDSAFFEARAEPAAARASTAFGMTKRAGRSASNDEVLAAVLNAGTPAVCLVGKTHDFHVATALGVTLDENLENIATSIRFLKAKGREALFDAEHFFDGYKADPDYALACLQGRARRRRPLGRALRHQRRHAAGRGRPHHRRGDRRRHPRRAARHPHPRRHRQRGRQLARRGRRRRAAGAGHAERPRRALRQRQPRHADPDAAAQGALRQPLRDRRQPRRPRRPHPHQPPARRHPEPGAEPGRALRRRLGLHPQGGAARQRDPQGPHHLRARAARGRRQRPGDPDVEPGRAVQPARAAGQGRDRGRARRPAARPHPAPRSRSARTGATPTTAPRRASRSSRASILGADAALLRGRALPGDGRAADERQGRDGDRLARRWWSRASAPSG